jgi:hypothetical protein
MVSGRNLIARRIDGNSVRRIKNIVLCVILICGSINVISNGIVSHNAAAEFLPLLAISADWFHVMAVSIWVGGLFYISLILLREIRISSSDLTYGTELDTADEKSSKKFLLSSINASLFLNDCGHMFGCDWYKWIVYGMDSTSINRIFI